MAAGDDDSRDSKEKDPDDSHCGALPVPATRPDSRRDYHGEERECDSRPQVLSKKCRIVTEQQESHPGPPHFEHRHPVPLPARYARGQ